ncbi:MAG: FG-GAP-like repeat-containing protein [Bacteroidota bacterium]
MKKCSPNLLIAAFLIVANLVEAQKLYFVQGSSTSIIQRSNLDGSNVDLNESGTAVQDLVVDPVTNRIFWIESRGAGIPDVIRVADISSFGGTISFANQADFLLLGSNAQPFALEIDLINRQIYWTERGDNAIARANIDTSTPVRDPVASVNFLRGLGLDPENGKMYYIQEITSDLIVQANLDGSSPVTVLDGTDFGFAAFTEVAVDELNDMIYFTVNNEIWVSDLDGSAGSRQMILSGLESPRGIDIDNEGGFLFYADSGPTGNIGRSSLDGSGQIDIVTGLDAPANVALDLSTFDPPKLYWSEESGSEINRSNLDGTEFEEYYTGFPVFPTGIDIDEQSGFIYWTNTDGQVRRAGIGETSFESSEALIDESSAVQRNVQGIAIDTLNRLMYWCSEWNSEIRRANLDGTGLVTLIDASSPTPITNPFGIALDVANGKMYYTDNNGASPNIATLYEADLDGSNVVPLISSTASPETFFRDVKLDLFSNTIYWSSDLGIDFGFGLDAGQINIADLNDVAGTATSFMTNGAPGGIDLEFSEGKIYWADLGIISAEAPGIWRANFDGSNPEELLTGPTDVQMPKFVAIDARNLILPTFLNLTSFTPTHFENTVPLSSNITFEFDQDVDASSLNGNIIVSGEQTGIIEGVLSGGGTLSISFNPDADFRSGEIIRVTLTTGILGTSGDPLNEDFSFQFTAQSGIAPESPAFFEERVISDNSFDIDVFHVFASDIDSDSDMDLLAISDNTNAELAWYENDGAQNFTRNQIFSPTSNGPQSVSTGDYDMDGDLDIISTRAGVIDIFDNDGAQNFTRNQINLTGVGTGIPEAQIIDIDADGDMDIMASVGFTFPVNIREIRWLENDGSQNFTLNTISSVTIAVPNSFYASDIDDDGDLDLTVCSLTTPNIAWYENDGNQNFTENVLPVSLVSNLELVFTEDIDGDGDVDLITSSSQGVVWFENDGEEVFTERIINNTSIGCDDTYASDMDGDGDIDLICSGRFTTTAGFRLFYFENDGTGSFTAFDYPSTANSMENTYVADIDSDGDLDVFIGAQNGSRLVWFENTSSIVACTDPVTVDAGPDQSVTFNSSASLSGMAGGPASAVLWETDGDGTFDEETNLSTIYTPGVSDRNSGSVTLTLTAMDPDGSGPCTEESDVLTLTIQPNQPPTAQPPTQQTSPGTVLSFEISELNFVDPENDQIIIEGIQGTIPDAIYEFTASSITLDYSASDFIGTDLVTIFFTDGINTGLSTQFQVEIGADIEVINAVAPQGTPGVNDFLQINFLPDNSMVTIFNRWGDRVYEMENYDGNGDDINNSFTGLRNVSGSGSLPSGTYYYNIRTEDGRELNGFLVLRR